MVIKANKTILGNGEYEEFGIRKAVKAVLLISSAVTDGWRSNTGLMDHTDAAKHFLFQFLPTGSLNIAVPVN